MRSHFYPLHFYPLIDMTAFRSSPPFFSVSDPELVKELEIDHLPPLSMVNDRELLCAVMPLPQPTVERATELVVELLVNRARSRKSRLKDLVYKHSLP